MSNFIRSLFLFSFLMLLVSISVSAESGTVQFSQSFTSGAYKFWYTGYSGSILWNTIQYDSGNYNIIESFQLNPSSFSSSFSFESTTFTVTSGGTGTGTAWYDSNTSKIYWTFNYGNTFTSSPLTLAYAKNIFLNVSALAYGNTGSGLSNINPVCVSHSNGACLAVYSSEKGYDQAKVRLDSRDYYSVTYPTNGYFSLNIIKNNLINTKYIIHGSSIEYSREGSFNKVNVTGAYFPYSDGIILNATLGSGYYVQTIVNSTNCPLCSGMSTTLIQGYPVTGANIYFDKTSYVIGDNVGVTYYVANSTWSSYLFSCEMEFYENDVRKKSVVLSSGADYLEYTPTAPGTLKTNIACGLFRKIEGTASVAVFPISQSYIYLLNGTTAKAGTISNFSYRWGFTPSSYRWINIYKYDSNQNTWIKESSNSVQTGSLANTLYTTSIIIKSAGKYAAELCDNNKQCPAAKIIFDSVYLPNTPISNYSVSNITIINPQASYAQNDWLRFSTRIDGTNYTTKSVSVRLYNPGTTTVQTLQYISNEAETNQVYLSSPMESGALSLQLVGANGSGIFVLAETPLTISIIDAGGYALTADRYRVCKNEVVAVSAISPGSATVTFSTVPVQRFNFSGSKTWSIKIAQDITVSLDVNGEQKKMIPIYVNASCGGIGTTPDIPGTGPEATTKFLSSGMLVVLIVMMIFAGAGQVIGGFSGAVIGFGSGFIFLSVFGYVPVWALFLFAIIAITAFAVMGGKSLVSGGG